jgi:hypothetical protein
LTSHPEKVCDTAHALKYLFVVFLPKLIQLQNHFGTASLVTKHTEDANFSLKFKIKMAFKGNLLLKSKNRFQWLKGTVS